MSIKDAGTTIRQASTALLTIDSEDRFANWTEKRAAVPGSVNYSPYNFSLIRDASLVNGYMTRLTVSEVVFPWLFPNVNRQTNQINVTFRLGGVDVSDVIVLNTGFYTPAQLAAEMKKEINKLGGPIVTAFTYGVYNLPFFAYTPANNYQIKFSPMLSNQKDGSGTIIYPFPDTTKQLFDVLGFTAYNSTYDASATGIGVGQATLAQAYRYIDIVSPQLVANQGLFDSSSQAVGHTALCRLYLGDTPSTAAFNDPLFSPPGTQPFVIHRQFSNPKQIAWNAIQPIQGRIQFQVYDDNGQLIVPTEFIAIPTGGPSVVYTNYETYTDWSMTLLLSEN